MFFFPEKCLIVSREGDPYVIGELYFSSTEKSHNLASGWVNNQDIFTESKSHLSAKRANCLFLKSCHHENLVFDMIWAKATQFITFCILKCYWSKIDCLLM